MKFVKKKDHCACNNFDAVCYITVCAAAVSKSR